MSEKEDRIYKTESGEAGIATYCPEDDKLRLYVGRIEKADYLELRKEGWKSTPKQECDFVATWTPSRADQCYDFADMIEDEDEPPEERAITRAERFGGYRDKRLGEATGFADSYESRGMAHGFQDSKRAERAANRHDRIGRYAVDAWSKAEYWTRRTAGVIANALYKSSPSVRMGRIKRIESDLRRIESYYTPRDEQTILQESRDGSGDKVPFRWCGMGRGGHWVEESDLESIKASYGRMVSHLKMRIAYENQMLEAQGGRLATVEMEVGGRLGRKLIIKVSKSSVTKRVTSVCLLGPRVDGYAYKVHNIEGTDYAEYVFKTERLNPEMYHAPDEESLKELADFRKVLKAAKAKKLKAPKLINPTLEDAQRLVDIWNERQKAKHDAKNIYTSESARARHDRQFLEAKVVETTQARYSEASKGAYARAETRGLCSDCELENESSNMWSAEAEKRAKRIGEPHCKIRITSGGQSCGWRFKTVIVLTDKPQKPLPASVWQPAKEQEPINA